MENTLVDAAVQAGALIGSAFEKLSNLFVYGPIVFVFMLVVVLLLSRQLTKFVRNTFRRRSEKDGHNYSFVSALINGVIYLLAGYVLCVQIVPLRQIAVSLLAGSGVLAIAVGLASQEAMANLVSGLFLVVFKPMSVGDIVRINDKVGVVEEISLRHTVLRTYDNNRVMIPNGMVNTSVLENYSIYDARVRNKLEISVSYSADLDKAREIIAQEVERHPGFIDTRTEEERQSGLAPVRVLCTDFEAYAVKLCAYVWGSSASSLMHMMSDLRLSIKKRFDSEGIEIPYPYSNVVLKNSGAEQQPAEKQE